VRKEAFKAMDQHIFLNKGIRKDILRNFYTKITVVTDAITGAKTTIVDTIDA
jgi:hypothetical protein